MLKFIGFVSITLIIVFGAHALLYTTIVRFIGLPDPLVRKTLMWVIVFFALSFFPSVLLLRVHVNPATQFYYLISASWLGLFIYLLMAVILTWVVFGIGKLIGMVPIMSWISGGFIMLAVLVFLYGIWCARQLEVNRIQVGIEGLPDHWKNKTIVQLSDVHLGSINKEGFLNRIIEKVNPIRPELILITGDLFDGMGGRLEAFIEPLNRLEAAKGIFFATGNHEGYLGLHQPLEILKKTNIRILDNEIVDLDGLQIVGISFPEHHLENKAHHLLMESGAYDPGKPSILMYHTPTNIGENHSNRADQQSRTYWFPDTSMALAKKAGIDLQLSGHTHKGQFFPFGLLTRAIFRGFDYGLHREGSFHVYISSGVGTWGPPIKIGSRAEIGAIQLR